MCTVHGNNIYDETQVKLRKGYGGVSEGGMDGVMKGVKMGVIWDRQWGNSGLIRDTLGGYGVH